MNQKIDRLLSRWNFARESVRNERMALESAQAKAADLEEASLIVQQVGQAVQQQAHSRIASVVTHCLKAIFGASSYDFTIDFERRRNQTEARLLFKRGEAELDPMDESGGGPIAVAAAALRIACLMLGKPARRRLLVLDEPFLALREDKLELVRGMLMALSRDLGIQIVLISHSETLKMGKVIELEDSNE